VERRALIAHLLVLLVARWQPWQSENNTSVRIRRVFERQLAKAWANVSIARHRHTTADCSDAQRPTPARREPAGL